MPDPDPTEEIDESKISTAGTGPAATTTQQPTNGAAQAAPAEPKGGQEEGVQQVRHSDFKRIKEEAKEKGRQQAISDLDARARAAGFADHDDALKALAALKKPQTPITQTPPPPQGTTTMPIKPATKNDAASKEAERLRQEQARANDERSKMRKQWRSENRKNRDLQAKLDAKDAEMALRDECYGAGIKDVDYSIRLLTRVLEGKSEQEIAAFDRKAFYDGLKKDKPYLFGETVAPATTGTNGAVKPGGTQVVAPTPGETQVIDAATRQFDARTAKPEDVQKRLRELGLNPHL